VLAYDDKEHKWQEESKQQQQQQDCAAAEEPLDEVKEKVEESATVEEVSEASDCAVAAAEVPHITITELHAASPEDVPVPVDEEEEEEADD